MSRSNYHTPFSAQELKPGKFYSFFGTAREGSHPMLLVPARIFAADFVGAEGGLLTFRFNGMPLRVDPSEVKRFWYEGFDAHGGSIRRKQRQRTRKTRKTRKTHPRYRTSVNHRAL
jgi:hypothetical protein